MTRASGHRAFGGMLVAVVTSVAIFASVGAQSPPPPQTAPAPAQNPRPPVFRAGANFVLVDAYPQRDGRIVEGLTASDFSVTEDGKPQAVESFEFVRVEPAPPETPRRDPGSLREMYALAADPHNRVFVVFLDTLQTTVEGSQRLHKPLVDTLDRYINPDDLFGVMTQDMRPQDLTLGRRLLTVDEQLSKYWAWGQRQQLSQVVEQPLETELNWCFHQRLTSGGLEDWIVDDGPVRRFLDDILIERRHEDRTLTGIENLVAYVGPLREARTVLLIVTDGWILFPRDTSLENQLGRDTRFAPALPPGGQTLLGTGRLQGGSALPYQECAAELTRLAGIDSERRFRDLIASANRTNVAVYPVAAGGLSVFDSSLAESTIYNSSSDPAKVGTALTRDTGRMKTRVQSLRTLAESTGGLAIVDTSDLGGGLKRVFDDVSAYYLLGYYSTNTKMDGRLRKIEVKMKAAGLTVRARPGYLAPKETARGSDSGSVAALVAPASGPTVVDAALGLLSRLRPSADLFTYASVAGEELSVVVELASRHVETSGAWARGGNVSVEIASPNGPPVSATATVAPGTRGVLLRVPTGGGAGPWTIKAHFGAGPNALDDRLDILQDHSLLLGEPILYRATPSPRSPLGPAADLEFRRTERLHVEFPRLKALDQRLVRLLDRRGQSLALGPTLTERETDGRPVVAVDVNLAPLAEGDYVVEVTAGSGAETETKLVAFRMVR